MKGILVKLAYGDASVPEVDAITLLALRMAFALPFYAVIGAIAWKVRARNAQPLPPARLMVMAVLVGLWPLLLAIRLPCNICRLSSSG
jgi:hypothetical protein